MGLGAILVPWLARRDAGSRWWREGGRHRGWRGGHFERSREYK